MSLPREAIRDELLILEIQDGRLTALEELVPRWQGRLLAHARGLVQDPDGAWDVVQESWLAIVRGVERLQDPASFRSWAFRIVTNKSRDWIAQRARRRTAPAPAAAEPTVPVDRAFDESNALGVALASLSGEQRTVLSLRYLEDLTLDEIAIALAVPAGTVKSRLYHARNQLKAVLDRQERDSERGRQGAQTP